MIPVGTPSLLLDRSICWELMVETPAKAAAELSARYGGDVVIGAHTQAELQRSADQSPGFDRNQKALVGVLEYLSVVVMTAPMFERLFAAIETGTDVPLAEQISYVMACELGATLITSDVMKYDGLEGAAVVSWMDD